MSRSTDQRNAVKALNQAAGTTQGLVDLIYANAVAGVRLANRAGGNDALTAADIPRLCVSAACQNLELLIGKYSRAQELDLTPEAVKVLRDTIVEASADMRAVLTEALQVVTSFADFAQDKPAPAEPDAEPETVN
jgi:hypothetical protein